MSEQKHGIEGLMEFAMGTIQSAGEHALSYYGKANPSVKFDEGLVTEAELTLRDFFRNQLSMHYPEHQIFLNNKDHKGYTHEGNGSLWVFDPLDGVANFQAGIPIWGISLALLENFWPVFGLFYMPVTGDLFHARAGRDAFRGKEKIRISMQENIDDESLLLTYSRFHQQCRATFPGKIRNMGCTTSHICYVAMGRADAAVVSNETYEDLAAGRVIIEAAGGKIYKMDGSELFLNEYLDGRRINDQLLVVGPSNYPLIRKSVQIGS